MSCGCGGGREPRYHPSNSHHWQGGGGITTPPELPVGGDLPILATEAPTAEQPDRASAPAAAAPPSFPWGLALLVVIFFALVRV